MIDLPTEGKGRVTLNPQPLTPQRRIVIGCTIAALAAVAMFVVILLVDGLSGHWDDVYPHAVRSIPVVTIPLLIWRVFLPIVLAPKEPGE